MRGHTNNNILKSAIGSIYMRALFDIDKESKKDDADEGFTCYNEGRMNAVVEVGIFLGIIKNREELYL